MACQSAEKPLRHELVAFLQQWGDIPRHMILPTLTYTIVYMGEYMLIMRSSLLDVLSEDYILTAKAKGLSTFQILKDHALKNAMLPLVTIIAINLGFTVAGAIQIEAVFSWPGWAARCMKRSCGGISQLYGRIC